MWPRPAALLLEGTQRPQATRLIDVEVTREITGLNGSHPRLDGGTLRLDYHDFYARLDHFAAETVPAFERFQAVKQAVLEAARDEMRVGEFKPKVLTSFVRNRLIDEVLLPLIGDNLAKQMGTAGEDTRTDRMGLLLLISPPGYGKTTLMEYVAARLGVVFMKINGPALGHSVTSLDPEEAPNAAAREELHKLNLAFEMGDNVVIYVDDIQHTNSEFLQKFISLCDATRRIEGVFRGKPRTYDLRGRKVAVVMAGNPYTESGERFRLPDMLTNRADTYNLGDIIGEHGEAFRVSYLENSLTSNPSLNGLAARSQSDVHQVIKIARTGSRDGVDFEAPFTSDEVDEMVKVMEKLIRVRDVVLRVNQEYIKSAGMEEEYRTEPPFLLQGSYRNMNRIAERVVPVMNDGELTTLIESSYEQDAQTLTTGAEAKPAQVPLAVRLAERRGAGAVGGDRAGVSADQRGAEHGRGRPDRSGARAARHADRAAAGHRPHARAEPRRGVDRAQRREAGGPHAAGRADGGVCRPPRRDPRRDPPGPGSGARRARRF